VVYRTLTIKSKVNQSKFYGEEHPSMKNSSETVTESSEIVTTTSSKKPRKTKKIQEDENSHGKPEEVVEPVIEELNCYIENQANISSTKKHPASSSNTSKKKRTVNAEMSFGQCLEGRNDSLVSFTTTSSMRQQSNVILHLKISDDYDHKNDEIVPDDMINHKQVFSYNPDLSIPSPYDSQQCFHSQPQLIESVPSTGTGANSSNATTNTNNEEECQKEESHEITNVNGNGTSYSSCKLCCWWCCHEILGGSDYRLPIRKYNLKFQSTGRFCSPECMVAFNFESGYRYGDVHRQYMWINYIYIGRRIDGTAVPIQSAPPRETLKIFGGNYTIEEFRNKSLNYNVTINASLQPLVPITGFTDEIVVEYKRSKAFIPLEKERVERATSELKLKRKKIKKGEKTLDDFMNLKAKTKN